MLRSWLLEDNQIEKNPLAKYPLPTIPQYVIRALTNDQINKLLYVIDKTTALGSKYYCILILLLDTGMRISELVKIKIDDIDFTVGLITVLGKGWKERVVPFSRWTKKELLRYISKFRPHIYSEDSPYLFPAVNDEHISINSVQQYMRRLAKKAGLDSIKVSPHVLRHTFATQATGNEANKEPAAP